MKNLNPNLVVDPMKVSKEMIERFSNLCSCHHKISNALYAVTRMIEVLNESPKDLESHKRKFGDAKSFWCAFAVNYYSCFNDGLGKNTRKITKHFSVDEINLHKEIENDRNKYFCHTETHNTSRIFQTGFDKMGLPEIGVNLFVKDHPSYAKNLAYKKLAEKAQNLISAAIKDCADAIKKDLVVRERNISDAQNISITIKPEILANISRVEEHDY